MVVNKEFLDSENDLFSDAFPHCQRSIPEGDLSNFLKTCEVDMCFTDDPEAKNDMIKSYLDICGDQAVKQGSEIEMNCSELANVQKRITGESPKCPPGQVFDGCATQCSREGV